MVTSRVFRYNDGGEWTRDRVGIDGREDKPVGRWLAMQTSNQSVRESVGPFETCRMGRRANGNLKPAEGYD